MSEQEKNTRTLLEVFLFLRGRIFRWTVYSGRINIALADDEERSVSYDNVAEYWKHWSDKIVGCFYGDGKKERDHLDLIFLSDDEEKIKMLPEWLFEREETSCWKREVLQQITSEEELQGYNVVLVTEDGRRRLGHYRKGIEDIRLYLGSSRSYHVQKDAEEELAVLTERTDVSADNQSVTQGTVYSEHKEKLLRVCNELRAVLEEKAVEYGTGLSKCIEDIEDQIRGYTFKIYLVGPFSCGKSSLLNRWLQIEHLLPTGIAPETAISTELRYGPIPCMELYPLNSDGTMQRLDGIGAANMDLVRRKANARDLLNVIIYLNHPKLRKYEDLCLVDLPGLSSVNPAHEAALNNFITERAVGIFCVPMADGTVHEDSLMFLKKMERFRSEFLLLLTKADEKGESEHAAIIKATVDAIRTTLGLSADDFRSGKVSKDSVEDFEKMLDFLKARKDVYLTNRFRETIRTVADEMVTPLKQALAVSYHNAKLNNAMANLEDTERHLDELVKDVLDSVRQCIPAATDRILEKVRQAVRSQKGMYLSMAKCGQDCSAEVASTIKNTISANAQDEMMDVVERANRKAEEILGTQLSLAVGDADISTSVDGCGGGNSGAGGKVFGTLVACAGGGGAGFWLGNLVFPGLGGIIGSILGSVLGSFFGRSNKVDEASRIEAEFTMQLENACNGTRSNIKTLLVNAVEAYGRDLKKVAENKLADLKEQMQQLQAETSGDRAVWETKQKHRTATLTRIGEILQTMEVANV